MSFRDDVSVDWGASPRVVEIAAPSTYINLQDLHDTLRTLAAQPAAMDEGEIVVSSGKEALGGGLLVGLTTMLLNAKLKFQARGAPPWVSCLVAGGNLVALDANGDPMNPIEPSAYTQVTMALSSSATLVEQEQLMQYVMSLL